MSETEKESQESFKVLAQKPFDPATRLESELRAVAQELLDYGRDPLGLQRQSRSAVVSLFRGESFLESEVLLTLRSKDLSFHAGEVAFPGGGAEEIDEGDPVKTALRECFEEVGIPPAQVKSFGILPSLVTVSGRSLVDPVLAAYSGALDFVLVTDALEVSRAEWVSVKTLRASRKTEMRVFQGKEIEFPYYQWGDEKMWGLTAIIFDLINQRYDRVFS